MDRQCFFLTYCMVWDVFQGRKEAAADLTLARSVAYVDFSEKQ